MTDTTTDEPTGVRRLREARAQLADPEQRRAEQAGAAESANRPQITPPVPGTVVHCLVSGTTLHTGGQFMSSGVVLTRGDNVVITAAMLDATRNRLGELGGIALAADEAEQVRRWGVVRFRVGEAPAELRPWVYGDAAWSTARETARRAAGAPIEVALGVNVIKELKGGRDHNTDSAAIVLDPDNTVRIAPSLVKRGMVKRYRLLVDGSAELTWTNQVADLQIRDLDQEWETPTLDRRIARVAARVIFILLGVIFLGGMLTLPFLPDEVPMAVRDVLPQPLGLFVFLPGAVLALGMGLFMYGANASRRPRRAVKVRNRGLAMSPKTSSEMLIRPRDLEYLD